MDPIRWALRLALWFRRRPSRQRVILIGVVVAASLAVIAIERLFGWPAALTVNRMPRIPRPHL